MIVNSGPKRNLCAYVSRLINFSMSCWEILKCLCEESAGACCHACPKRVCFWCFPSKPLVSRNAPVLFFLNSSSEVFAEEGKIPKARHSLTAAQKVSLQAFISQTSWALTLSGCLKYRLIPDKQFSSVCKHELRAVRCLHVCVHFPARPPPFFPFTPVFERQIIFPFSCRRWIPHSNGLSCWKLKEDILIPMTYKDEFAKRGCMTCAFLSLPVRMNHCTFMFSTFFFFHSFVVHFSHTIFLKKVFILWFFFCRIIKSWKSLHWHMRAPQPLDQVLSPPELRPTFPCTIFRGSHSRRVFMNPSAAWILFENLLKGYRSPRCEVLCPKASWA